MRWRVLKQFRVLPTEDRARGMKDGDYLWCLVQELLDREEKEARMCPACRARAAEECCPVCGLPVPQWGESAVNDSFDPERFRRMREGGER